MLLLHTLRVFFKKNGNNDVKEVNEKELLKIFTHKNNEENILKYGEFDFDYTNVTQFMNLLWRVRFAFDEHIIKWVNIDDNTDEVHFICKIIENNSKSPSLQRDKTEESKSFSLLQSMLYHTQPVINHYWLTPLLYKLVYEPEFENTEYLQNMDNYLFFPKKSGDLKENTWNLLSKSFSFEKETKVNILSQFDLIDGSDYRQFSHYLFYKVEYILWYEGFNLDKEIKKDNNFYFRAKNSVEHIESQTEDNEKKQDVEWSRNLLDSFGNLALVSRERNSEYSNLTFKEKKSKFEAYKDSNQHLKMSLIYQNDSWTDESCKKHLEEIKERVGKYMNCGETNESK